MARIAVIVDELFEDSEYTRPVEEFRGKGHETVNVGLSKGKKVRGKREGTEITIDRAAGEEDARDYDALLIPGGYSPDKLRAHDEAVEFTRWFFMHQKPVFVICHGPQLLVSADVLKGYRVTCYKSVVADVLNAGAIYFDTEVVVDRNLVSSRQPGDLPRFIEESLKLL